MSDTPSITCPLCGATSYNPADRAEGYCGRCHDWTTPSARSDEEILREFDELLAGSTLSSPAASYMKAFGRDRMAGFLERLRQPGYRDRLLMDADDPDVADPSVSTGQLFGEFFDLLALVTMTPEDTEAASERITPSVAED